MRGPTPPTIELTDPERHGRDLLVRRHTPPQQIARRARIVLAAADGANNGQIAHHLAVSRDTVRRWRERWLGLQPAPLDDVPIADRLTAALRPGKPRRITAEQACQIIALACEPPPAAQRPLRQWTGQEIADAITPRGSVAELSGRHAPRWLTRGRSNRP